MTETSLAAKGQVTATAAEIYDACFVPALFGQFAPPLVDFADILAGDRVLDVATGTGIAALAARERGAEVTGIDVNPGMLAVARRKSDDIVWAEGDVAALPFDDGTFDTVLCQFALMFFPDRAGALAEMLRILKPGGTLAIATWSSLDDTPAYRDLVPLLNRIVGPEAATALSAPFVLGDREQVATELAAAGAKVSDIRTETGTARHPSFDDWLDTEIGGWTMAEIVDAAQLRALKDAARPYLADYESADGTVAFAAPAIFFLARKRPGQGGFPPPCNVHTPKSAP